MTPRRNATHHPQRGAGPGRPGPGSGRRRLAGLLLLLALGGACAGSVPLWAEQSFEGIGYGNLYVSVVDLLEVEGYVVATRNPDSGVIESEWAIGPSIREVRGPSRRKAVVEIDRDEELGHRLRVRLRVREQVIRKGGMTATNLRHSDDWEDWQDNFNDAEYLAAKLQALLVDYVPESSVIVTAEVGVER